MQQKEVIVDMKCKSKFFLEYFPKTSEIFWYLNENYRHQLELGDYSFRRITTTQRKMAKSIFIDKNVLTAENLLSKN